MKKLLVCMAAMLVALGISAAEQGQQSVGVSIGVAPNLANTKAMLGTTEFGLPYTIAKAPGTNFQIALKYDYNVAGDIRLEAGLESLVRSNDHSMLDVYLNGHYLIDVMDKFVVYPLVGLGYGRESVYYDIAGLPSTHESMNRLIFNIGAGADYELTDKLVANLEFKYMYVNHFDKFPISIGVRYKF